MAPLKRRFQKTLQLINTFLSVIFGCICLVTVSLIKCVKANTKNTLLFLFVTVSLIIYLGLDDDYDSSDLYRNQVSSMDYFYSVNKTFITHLRPDRITVKLSFVVCSTRLKEAMTMLTTAVFFSRKANVNLYLIAIADLRNEVPLAAKLKELSEAAMELDIHVNYEIHRIWLPDMPGKQNWVEMFAPCSSQRLFFPVALPHIDHLLYIDTDALFLSNITDLWNEFKNMKALHIAAVAAEHELPGDGWYNRKSRIPYYGPRGLNAGIMLMNLTAMRKINFGERIQAIFQQYGSTIKWADQDLMNILFHFDPEYLYELDCKYNYRVQHCQCDFPESGDCGCKSAERNGISIFHGNRATFHPHYFDYFNDPPYFIKYIYKAFSMYDLRSDAPEKLLDEMMATYMDETVLKNKTCGHIRHALFKNFQQFTQNILMWR